MGKSRASSRSSKTKSARSRAAKKSASADRRLKIGLIGFGTVGRSVAKILAQDSGSPLVLTHIFNRGIKKKKISSLPANIRWTENVDDVLSSDVDVVVELIGGLEPAGQWVRKALRAGKSVVTANKLLLSRAAYFRRLRTAVARPRRTSAVVPISMHASVTLCP